MQRVTYKTDLESVDWSEMKATLHNDAFDNGRTPEQLKKSFTNSYAACIAYADKQIIGTARVLSDGICNAYVVDVWTRTHYRHQGIARKMMQILLDKLKGQHVYLFTDDNSEFYTRIGFTEQPIGMGQVVGRWLVND